MLAIVLLFVFFPRVYNDILANKRLMYLFFPNICTFYFFLLTNYKFFSLSQYKATLGIFAATGNAYRILQLSMTVALKKFFFSSSMNFRLGKSSLPSSKC